MGTNATGKRASFLNPDSVFAQDPKTQTVSELIGKVYLPQDGQCTFFTIRYTLNATRYTCDLVSCNVVTPLPINSNFSFW